MPRLPARVRAVAVTHLVVRVGGDRVCSRCKSRPAAASHRWCNPCKVEYERQRRHPKPIVERSTAERSAVEAAVRRLVDAHRDEFDLYYRQEVG